VTDDPLSGLVRQAEELGLYEATDGPNPLRRDTASSVGGFGWEETVMGERDDGSIEHGPDCLADLVQRARLRAAEVYLGSGNRDLQYLLAEYDRRGELLTVRDAELNEREAIVQAAFRLAESYDPHSVDEVDGDLLAALIREVRR
jgi:hypothetical protein